MDHEQTEAEVYRRTLIKLESEIEMLKNQIAAESEQKYRAYKRIAELTSQPNITTLK